MPLLLVASLAPSRLQHRLAQVISTWWTRITPVRSTSRRSPDVVSHVVCSGISRLKSLLTQCEKVLFEVLGERKVKNHLSSWLIEEFSQILRRVLQVIAWEIERKQPAVVY